MSKFLETMCHHEIFYVYESKEDNYRTLVFHDEAWHWAMLKIFGDGYWRSKPELSSPCKGYEKESDKDV